MQVRERIRGAVAVGAAARRVGIEVEHDGRICLAGLRDALREQVVAYLQERVLLLELDHLIVLAAELRFRGGQLIAERADFLRERIAVGDVLARRVLEEGELRLDRKGIGGELALEVRQLLHALAVEVVDGVHDRADEGSRDDKRDDDVPGEDGFHRCHLSMHTGRRHPVIATRGACRWLRPRASGSARAAR